jgi:hypothetical protein
MSRSFRKPSTRPARRFLPGLESLESRWCPSTAGITQTGHALTLQGDGANDMITVSDNGQGGVTASITLAGRTQTLSAAGITSIDIEGGGGNDTISYALTGALGEHEPLMVCLGKGNSQAALDYSAGLNNATLAVAIGGGAGSNQVTTQFGALSGSRLNLTEFLGAGGATSHVNFAGPLSNSLATVTFQGGSGKDHVFAQLAGSFSNSNLQFLGTLGSGGSSFDLEAVGTAQDPITLQNSVVHFDIDGGSGGNTITFNAGSVNVDTTSRLNLETCSGTGNDTVNVSYSGQMNGELDLDLQGGPGNDTMHTTLTLAQGSTGRFRGQMLGGKGDDVMSFLVYDHSNPGGKSTLSLLDALLDGGSGHNTLSATPNVKVIN